MQATLDMIGIVTQDMARTLAFYRLLGVEIAEGAENEDHVEATLPGGLRLGFDGVDVIRSFDPEWQPASGGPQIALAFLCGSPSEVDETYARLESAGFAGRKAPWDAFWGQRYALARDPEGNSIDLFAPLPGDGS